jgi:hypothetical protein
MYMSPLERYGFMRPEASGGAGIINIYVDMAKQLSISLIAPLVGHPIDGLIPFLHHATDPRAARPNRLA